jgi:hypothetical protein
MSVRAGCLPEVDAEFATPKVEGGLFELSGP